MDKRITFKKLKFLTALPIMQDVFNVISNERDRLSRWFWWCSENITPTKTQLIIFVLLYIAETKRRKLIHKFNPKKCLYDEQFIIMVDGKFGGMIGLDCIDDATKDAEVWYFVSKENEGSGIASTSVQYITDYALNNNIKHLHANICLLNERSINLAQKNGFEFKENRYGDIVTYEKSLAR